MPKLGETSNESKSGLPLYSEGEVRAVRAAELGADMKGSWTRRSWGDTVPRFEAALEAPLLKSKLEATAGEEKAVEAPPSKTVKSSKSTSVEGYEQG